MEQISFAELMEIAIGLGDGFGMHISILLTIVSGYLVICYLVADKLTTVQITIVNSIYVVAYSFQVLALLSYTRALMAVATRINELRPTAGAGYAETLGMPYIGAFVLVSVFFGSLWFMWTIRRDDT